MGGRLVGANRKLLGGSQLQGHLHGPLGDAGGSASCSPCPPLRGGARAGPRPSINVCPGRRPPEPPRGPPAAELGREGSRGAGRVGKTLR